jgi:hypothetical protein
MSKAKPAKARARVTKPEGELEDAALDEVAGGGGTKISEAAEMSEDVQSALQGAVEQQQQTAQLLGNMSKSMHDTAKALIKNMKA